MHRQTRSTSRLEHNSFSIAQTQKELLTPQCFTLLFAHRIQDRLPHCSVQQPQPPDKVSLVKRQSVDFIAAVFER